MWGGALGKFKLCNTVGELTKLNIVADGDASGAGVDDPAGLVVEGEDRCGAREEAGEERGVAFKRLKLPLVLGLLLLEHGNGSVHHGGKGGRVGGGDGDGNGDGPGMLLVGVDVHLASLQSTSTARCSDKWAGRATESGRSQERGRDVSHINNPLSPLLHRCVDT